MHLRKAAKCGSGNREGKKGMEGMELTGLGDMGRGRQNRIF